MLKILPSPLKGALNALFLAAHTIFWCMPMYVFLILKFLSPNKSFRAWTDKVLVKIANGWISTNSLWMLATHRTKWDIPNMDHLKLNDWYFITCNHQSWTDILILHRIFLGKIPFIRFFIKRELLFLPFLGLAWWAYDFPIMSRYSKQQIAKNPSLRGKDLEATKKACKIYQNYPVTILNFLEGTRNTAAKHKMQKSPYKNLLIPKLGGFSFAIYAMDKKITHVLDVTIAYPYGKPSFWQFLCGDVKEIKVHIQEFEIPQNLLEWDDLENPEQRKQFSDWVNHIWEEKDKRLESLKAESLQENSLKPSPLKYDAD